MSAPPPQQYEQAYQQQPEQVQISDYQAPLNQQNLYGIPPAAPGQLPLPPQEEESGKGKKKKKKKKRKGEDQMHLLVPLPATGSIDDRLTSSAPVAATPPPAFTVEAGTVVPKLAADGQKKKKKSAALTAGSFAGGRWKVFAFRSGALLALGIIMLAGIMSMVSSPAEEEEPPGANFPVQAAQGYAAQFVQIYYSWSDTSEEARNARALALRNFFVDEREDAERDGWNSNGVQLVQSVVPAGVKVVDDNRANLQFGMLLNQGTAMPYQCVDVPVYANLKQHTFAILGMPSFVPCDVTSKAEVPELTESFDPDEEGRFDKDIEEDLEKFFTAYGVDAREELRTWRTASSNVVRGLNSPMLFQGFDKQEIYLQTDDNRRVVYVRVRWKIVAPDGSNRGEIASDYIVRVRLSSDNNSWQVEELQTGVPNPNFAPAQDGPPVYEEEGEATSDVPGQETPSPTPTA